MYGQLPITWPLRGRTRMWGANRAPFATLQKAHDVAVAGDTIFLRGGTYTFAPTVITRDGTSGNTIKVFCFPSEVPVIDAATNATGTASYPIFLQAANWWHFWGHLRMLNSISRAARGRRPEPPSNQRNLTGGCRWIFSSIALSR